MIFNSILRYGAFSPAKNIYEGFTRYGQACILIESVQQNCKNARHTKLPQNHIKNAKAIKFLLLSAFYTSKGSTCKVLTFLQLLV